MPEKKSKYKITKKKLFETEKGLSLLNVTYFNNETNEIFSKYVLEKWNLTFKNWAKTITFNELNVPVSDLQELFNYLSDLDFETL